MLFWILVAVLTAAVASALLMPLLRARAVASTDAAYDAEVYRDQLDELRRDEASGLIGAAEAELARAEVARRLIAARTDDRGSMVPTARGNRIAQALVILAIPAVGLCLYLPGGRPDLPSQPLAARYANPGNDIAILIARAERHLVENPNDGAGWDLLAPIYFRSGRMEDSVNAFREAIRILGDAPDRLDGYAEAQIAMGGGVVTSEARQALERSLALNAENPRARYYLALGLEQEGKRDEAKTAFEALAASAPADAPWLPLVNRHIATLSGDANGDTAGAAPGNPTQEDVAAAAGMESGDRQQMIEGMVASLASRLEENPDNLEGWLRIIRSYVVLDQRDKAATAVRTALRSFPADSDGGRQVLALGRELNIATGDDTQ